MDVKKLINDPVFSSPFSWAKFFRGMAIVQVEFWGVALFVFIGCGSLVNTPTVPSQMSHFNSTFAFILGINMALWIAGPISGGVLNPALSLCLLILNHFSIARCIAYILAQLGGAVMGIVLHWLILPDLDNGYCRQRHKPDVSVWHGFLFECLASAVVGWALCGLVDKRRFGTIRHLSIKFFVVLVPIILNVTDLYGSNVNPAVAFGGAMVALNFDEFWVFFFGPIIGACVWAIIYRLLLDAHIEEKSDAKKHYNVIE